MSDYDRRLYMSEKNVNVTVSGYLNGNSYQRQYRGRLSSYYDDFAHPLDLNASESWPTNDMEQEIWKVIVGEGQNREQRIASLVGEMVARGADYPSRMSH